MLVVQKQKSYNSLLPPEEPERDEEWFDDLDHTQHLLIQAKCIYIAECKMLR